MTDDNFDAYLKHYGVKGMRWGVRKSDYREYKDVATKDTGGALTRVQARVNMTRYFATGGLKKTQVKFDEDWYNNLDTGKKFIEKNTKLNRVTRAVDSNALAGRLYVSKLASDTEMYKATIPAVQKRMEYGKKEYHTVYQLELQTKRRLAMPSPKERVDTFIETIQTPEGKKWLSRNGYKDQIDELNAKEVGLKYYQTFNRYAGNQAVKFNDVYFNQIKQKGYDALIDDNDAGIWSKKPTILLSPKSTVKVTKVKQLSAAEINLAQKNVLKYRDYKNKEVK